VYFLQGEHVVAAQFCEFISSLLMVAGSLPPLSTFQLIMRSGSMPAALETRAEAVNTKMVVVFMGGCGDGVEEHGEKSSTVQLLLPLCKAPSFHEKSSVEVGA
jgi:hypothetical protein